jgi:excisionase family DNA binding protein
MALKDSYFTITQAAKELGVTRQTISRWIEQGKLSAERVGREILIAKQEFDKPEFRSKRERASNLKLLTEQLTDSVKKVSGYEDGVKLEVQGYRTEKDGDKTLLIFSVTREDGTREFINVKIEYKPGKLIKKENGVLLEVPATIEIKKPQRDMRGRQDRQHKIG